MSAYEFTLRFELPPEGSAEDYVESLAEERCDDALIGLGQPGRIALAFTREAESAQAAIFSALRGVKRAIPEATLIEAAPDLVGVTELAELLGCSRQNMRKLMLSCPETLPAPLHEGKPSLWHLAQVLSWLRVEKDYALPEGLLALAEMTMQVNLAAESRNLDASIQAELAALSV